MIKPTQIFPPSFHSQKYKALYRINRVTASPSSLSETKIPFICYLTHNFRLSKLIYTICTTASIWGYAISISIAYRESVRLLNSSYFPKLANFLRLFYLLLVVACCCPLLRLSLNFIQSLNQIIRLNCGNFLGYWRRIKGLVYYELSFKETIFLYFISLTLFINSNVN